MRVAIAGAGAVGRSIAAELLESEHQVMLIERELSHIEPEAVEAAEWVHADACELASLEEAGLEVCDVVIAARSTSWCRCWPRPSSRCAGSSPG